MIDLTKLTEAELHELDNAVFAEILARRLWQQVEQTKKRQEQLRKNREERAKDPEAYDRKTCEDAQRALDLLAENYMDEDDGN